MLALCSISSMVLAILGEVKSNFWADNTEVNIFGPQDDAANAAPRSIYWAPDSEKTWEPPQRQGMIGTPGSLWVRPVLVSFLIFGGTTVSPEYSSAEALSHDTDESEALLCNLINAIHRQLGPTGYEEPSVSWFLPGRDGMGMSCELEVTLRLPLVREDNPVATITAVSPQVEIVHE